MLQAAGHDQADPQTIYDEGLFVPSDYKAARYASPGMIRIGANWIARSRLALAGRRRVRVAAVDVGRRG